VSSNTDAVLAIIDGALTDYGFISEDEMVPGGMRWSPEPVSGTKNELVPPDPVPFMPPPPMHVSPELIAAQHRHSALVKATGVAAVTYAAVVIAAVMVPFPAQLALTAGGAVAFCGIIRATTRAYRRFLKLAGAEMQQMRTLPLGLCCPACGHDTFADAAVITMEPVAAGKWGACLACGEIAVYDHRDHLRLPAEAERDVIAASAPPEITAAIDAIKGLRQMDDDQ
jgi:hypothetical protein